jgi:hypothetical protein
MKQAIYCALVAAGIGFAVAVWVCTASPQSGPKWMSTPTAYILCPPGILAGITMTDPDPQSIWLLFGPLNAAIYGALGFTLWLFFRGDDGDSRNSKKSKSRPPLDL